MVQKVKVKDLSFLRRGGKPPLPTYSQRNTPYNRHTYKHKQTHK